MAATLYVGPHLEYKTIQSAINASSDGDTIYVYGGEYHEPVIIDKKVTLIGLRNSSGSRPLMLGWPEAEHPGAYAAMNISAGGTIVDGFDFRSECNDSYYSNYNTGILIHTNDGFMDGSGPDIQSHGLHTASGCVIRNVSITNCCTGISIDFASNTKVTDSVFTRDNIGVDVRFGRGTVVSRNQFVDSHYSGMAIDKFSPNCVIVQNNFVGYKHRPIRMVYAVGNVSANTSSPVSYTYKLQPCRNFTGNYWSEYRGMDGNSDGIGDSPFLIDVAGSGLAYGGTYNFTDNYPAMGPWSFENGYATIEEPTNPDTPTILHVGPDRYYKSIQSAINASHDGDTIYVDGGEYPRNLMVNKSLKLIGLENSTGGRPLITHVEPTVPAVNITASSVVVDGFDLQGVNSPDMPWQNRSEIDTGIRIEGRSCQIRNTSISGFANGVRMVYYGGNGTRSTDRESIIAGSNISSNVYGVWMDGESNVSIVGNDFVRNTVHLLIVESDHIAIYQNNFILEHKQANFVHHGMGVVRNSTSPVSYTYKDRQFTNYTGNYWSDYAGTDSNGDGIGDTAYLVETREWNGVTMNYTDDYPAIAPMSSYSFEKDRERLTVTAKPDLYGVYPPASLHVLHVGPGQIYSTIQRAVNVSADGDTIYVHGDVYPEAVVIDKRLILIGVPNSTGGRPLLTDWPAPSALGTYPAMEVTARGVTLDGFDLRGDHNSTGIRVSGEDCLIRNVTISFCLTGVELGANNTTVTRSVLSSNIGGVKTHYASNVTVARNDFIDNQKIAFLSFTSYATFFQNNFINNSWGVSPSITNNVRINTTTPVPYTFRGSVFTNRTGNFWSNNTAVDDNHDGIADAPYTSCVLSDFGWSWNFTDDYPAIGRWSFDNGTATIGEPTMNRSTQPVQNSTPTATPQESGYDTILAPIGLLVAAFICGLAASRKRS